MNARTADDAGYAGDVAFVPGAAGITPGTVGGNLGGGPAGVTAFGSTYLDSMETDAPVDDYADGDQETDADLEATRLQIEQTRSQMSTTIDAIQEKLSPANIAQQAKDTVKEATVGKAQEMVSNAGNAATDMVSNAGDTAKGFTSNIIETIKANPVPAAIAGIGLGWLFMSGRNQGSSNDYAVRYPAGYNPGPSGQYSGYGASDYNSGPSGTSPLTDRLNRTQDQVGNFAGQAQNKASDVASSVQDTVGQVAGNVQDTASQLADSAQYGAQRAQSAFQQSLHSNPLAVGVVALAVGAAIGLSIPETDKENELLGETRDNVVQQAQQTVGEKAQQVQTVAQQAVGAAKDAAGDAAQQQGLTTS
jgi:ElaB/YqjD/DUF883 family membrane-anchored ribosome-binding protein